MTDQERIAQLEAQLVERDRIIARLEARIAELEARLSKDSHNSSKPPSSDGYGRRKRAPGDGQETGWAART